MLQAHVLEGPKELFFCGVTELLIAASALITQSLGPGCTGANVVHKSSLICGCKRLLKQTQGPQTSPGPSFWKQVFLLLEAHIEVPPPKPFLFCGPQTLTPALLFTHG